MKSRLLPGLLMVPFMLGGLVASVHAADITTRTFFSPSQFKMVKISPDGHYLAVVGPVKGEDEKTQLDFIDLHTMKLKGNVKLVGEQQIANLWWKTGTRVVFTTATQTGSFDQPSATGDIWAVDVDGKNSQTLAFHAAKGMAYSFHYNTVLSLLPDDPRHILIETRDFKGNPSVSRVDIQTADKRRVMTSPIQDGDLVTDNNGDVRLVQGSNEKTLQPILEYREPDSLDWKDISSLVADQPHYLSVGPVAFTPDNKQLYFEMLTPKGTLGLYRVDPQTLKKTLLYSDPDFDIDNTYSSTYWLFGGDDKTLVAFQYTSDLPQWIAVDQGSSLVGLISSLQNAFPGQSVLVTSKTADGKQAVVLVRSDRNPGSYYYFNAATGKVQFLFNAKSGIDPEQMAAMKPVTFKSRDGLTIHGYLTLPRGQSKNLPLIIHPHGGPFTIRDEWQFDPEVQYLAYHGYAVLQVNYRGSGGYGLAFQQAGYKQWGGTMQDDLTDATHWAIDQGIADPKRICIYGASYGGYASLEGVVKEPDLYQCAVGYAGVYDLVLLRDSANNLQRRSLIPFMKSTLGDDEAVLKAHSPVFNVKRIKADLMLAHGGADHTVDIKHADELRSALDKIGKHYEWLYYPNEGHGFYTTEHQVVFYNKLLDFLDKEIGAGAVKH
ncbi:MAG TPA: S9 family peptidase [Gammaproteobacteria bacterium]|nr:S9 family peptidase [Gammaproteobacteria bacterium]